MNFAGRIDRMSWHVVWAHVSHIIVR